MRALIAGVGLLSMLSGSSAAESTLAIPPGLSPEQGVRYESGAREFEQRWVVAPSPFGAWGRGPTSNGESCTDCHLDGGRGRPPANEDEPLRAGLLRISLPGRDAHGAPLPHPAYGDQIQFVGSSRVDLQACKLEYSIVSPK